MPYEPSADAIAHAHLLLESFVRVVGRELIPRTGTRAEQARHLFEAPFVVVSHGIEPDPVLNYGNLAALQLWEMDHAAFVLTPSRLTAEPVHRDERARLLARTLRDGYVDDYQGVRVSRSGQRFRIERAIVWNVIDADGHRHGQAATFDSWVPLPSSSTDSPTD